MGDRYAGVLALHGDSVALVRESYPAWGGSFWNVPSGAVEQDESPADGAARELREETGLVVSSYDLELIPPAAYITGNGRRLGNEIPPICVPNRQRSPVRAHRWKVLDVSPPSEQPRPQ